MTTCESNEKRLECKFDKDFTVGTANALRFETNKVPKLTNCLEKENVWSDKDKEICKPNGIEDHISQAEKSSEEAYKKNKDFFTKQIVPWESTSKNTTTYDDQAMADSLWDGSTFWTWQSPFAIAQTCEKMKKEVGGQFIFAIGQDSTDLVHIKAFQECVKDWK